MKSLLCSVAAALALWSAGCQSAQHYQAQAAEKAREYLLEHAPELTAEEVAYVKYNEPVFLYNQILGDHSLGKEETTSSYQQEVDITWQIPGRDELYLVVGESSENLFFWTPTRLIRKKFVNQPLGQLSALSQARSYVTNFWSEELSSREMNSVLYLFPEIRETNLELNFNPEGKFSDEALAKIRESVKKRHQISLVWRGDDREIVFSGYANDTISGWSLLFAGMIPETELTEHTIKVVCSPDEFNREITLAPIE